MPDHVRKGADIGALSTVRKADQPDTYRVEPRFQHFTVTDGLASVFAKGLLQDRQGFLWIATADGLNRFDGETFVSYYAEPGARGGLSQNHTNRLLEDDLGGLWIGHVGGVDRFDPTTETFVSYNDSLGGRDHAGVYGLAKDAAGVVWVAYTDGTLGRADPAAGTWRHVVFPEGADAPESLWAVEPGADGTLWLGGASGLHRYDPASGALAAVPFAETGQGTPPSVFALHRDRSGRLWIGTVTDGLHRLDVGTGALRHYPGRAAGPDALGHDWVLTIAEDAAGTLWVGTNGGGLARYDADRDAFDRTLSDDSDPSSLSANAVTAILEDRTGVLWVGTPTSGLDRRLPLSTAVAQVRHRPGDPASLAPTKVTAFAEDANGGLWVGTEAGGLVRRDPSTGTFSRVAYGPAAPHVEDPPAVYALARDAAGSVWVAAADGLFRGSGGRFARLPAPPSAGELAAAPDGSVWVGDGDLYRVDARGVTAQLAAPAERDGSVTDVLPGPGGTADVATFGRGVYRLGPDGDVVARWLHDAGDDHSLTADLATALHRDARGDLWVGTNQGLNRIEEQAGRTVVTRYGRPEGLPHPTVNAITSDAQGRIWVGTYRGLARLDSATGAFQTFHASDGLQGDAVVALYRSARTGRIYVGGEHGYDVFDPQGFPRERPPGPVALTGLRLDGEAVEVGGDGSPLTRALSSTPELRIGPGVDAITLRYAALDFGAPGTYRYGVEMEGLHDGWRGVGGQREVTFAGLGPGRYTFRVRAAGRDGVWGAPSDPLVVVVVPPWWRTWWALLLYAGLVLGAGVLVVRVREERRQLAQRAEAERVEADALRQLDHARSQFFANVSHEFRTPLTLTLGPLDDVLSGEYGALPEGAATQLSLARRSAGRVLGLINQILDVSRLEAGSTPLRACRLDLVAFVRAQAEAFLPLALQRRIKTTADVPDTPVEVYADPDHLGTILVNLLSNAFKFTPEGGTIHIEVGTDDLRAQVAVRDTGPGISAVDLPHIFDRFYQSEGTADRPLGSGIGLALACELATLHGGRLDVESQVAPPSGSTFTLALPLGTSHLAPHQIVDRTWTGTTGSPLLPDALDGEPAPGSALPIDDDRTTVLVVDDNADIRVYVRRHLEAGGYRVVEAGDGEEALVQIRARLPDLVVSDVMMPRLDGLGLCRAIRSDPETDFVPVLLLTAKASPEAQIEGLAELCDDYLTKPFDVRQLVARAGNLIEIRRRLRRRFSGDGADAEASLKLPKPVSADDAFVGAVRAAIEANLGDDTFGVEALAEAVGQSRSHLLRRTTELMGVPPSELIRTARLDRAAALLAARAGTVSEVAYGVGFKSVAHFSNAFLAHTGVRPSAYAAAAS